MTEIPEELQELLIQGEVRTILVKPSDVLIISNVGDITDSDIAGIGGYFRDHGINVALFAENANFTVIAQSAIESDHSSCGDLPVEQTDIRVA